jgi:hypothetical protein
MKIYCYFLMRKNTVVSRIGPIFELLNILISGEV